MSVARAIELLSPDNEPHFSSVALIAIRTLDHEALASATDPMKHRLKVRISALLKLTGTSRAFGCVLARRMVETDWSAISSHGKSWLVSLLHILDLPDEVCWLPAARTIVVLFDRIHGKPEFSREMGGSKVTEFAKKLVKLCDKGVDVTAAITRLLELYPTQCRPSLSSFRGYLRGSLLKWPQDASRGLAAVVCAEKNSIPSWQQALSDTVGDISNLSNSQELKFLPKGTEEQQWNAIFVLFEHLIRFSPTKIPTSTIVDTTLRTLETFNPSACVPAMNFLVATMAIVPWELAQLDRTLQCVSECAKMSYNGAKSALRVFSVFLAGPLSWMPAKYNKLVSRLVNRGFEVLESNRSPVGATGLADFVKSPKDFIENFDPDLSRILARFLETVIIGSCEIPLKLRFKIDRFLLTQGGQELNSAVLYPGKFSVLPLALSKSGLKGYECLVHPRFPPLPSEPTPSSIEAGNESNELVQSDFIPVEEPAGDRDESQDGHSEQSQNAPLSEDKHTEQELPTVAPLRFADATAGVGATQPPLMDKLEESNGESNPYEPEAKRQKTDELEEEEEEDDDIVIPAINVDDDDSD